MRLLEDHSRGLVNVLASPGPVVALSIFSGRSTVACASVTGPRRGGITNNVRQILRTYERRVSSRRHSAGAVPYAKGSMPHWLRRHPFLSLGLGSFVFLAALLGLPTDSRLFPSIGVMWRLLGFGPHLSANLLARWAPGLPGWLDGPLVVLLGLLPYLGADALLARMRRLPAIKQAPHGEESPDLIAPTRR